MTWYMLPAALALLVKLWLLFTLKSRAWAGKRWAGFVAIFCVHNLSELLVFNTGLQQGLSADFLIRCYYACTCMVIVYSFIYAMNERQHAWQKKMCYTLSLSGAIVIALIFLTDLIISGYDYFSYSVMAIKGDGYFLFRVYAWIGIVSLFATLAFNFIKAETRQQEVHYFYSFIAFLPLIIIGLLVMILMALGINIAMLLPVGSTLFLIISLHGKNRALIQTSWRSLVPYTLEYDMRRKLRAAQMQYINADSSHQETMMQIEKALLEYQRDKHGGSIAKASKSIGIMRSTFYSKMNRLNKT